MKIKTVLSQHRRDMQLLLECEHCQATEKRPGYDDAHYHKEVIPNLVCCECGKKAPDNYRPLATKYEEGKQV